MHNYIEVEKTLRSVAEALLQFVDDGIDGYYAGILDDLVIDLLKARAAMTVLENKENA